MVAVLASLQLPCDLDEDKRHPSTPRIKGRARFLLRNEDGELYNEEIDTKQTLLLILAEKIPQLKSRQLAKEEAEKQKATVATAAAKGNKKNVNAGKRKK